MTEDIIRVVRIIEYVGPRELVEIQVSRSSIHGEHKLLNGVTIRTATLGTYPEILEKALIAEQKEQS